MLILSSLILQIVSSTLALNVCPEGWKQYKLDNDVTKCVKIFYEMVNREQAEDKCNLIGNDISLIEIHSKRENDLVVEQMLESNVNEHLARESNDDPTNHNKAQAWIGPTGVPGGGLFDFAYASGCGTKDYANWSRGQPNNYNGSQDCVFMYTNASFIGQWNDYQCNNKMYYICQWTSDPSPPCVVSNYYFHLDYRNTNTKTSADTGVIEVIDAGFYPIDDKSVDLSKLRPMPNLENLLPLPAALNISLNGSINLPPVSETSNSAAKNGITELPANLSPANNNNNKENLENTATNKPANTNVSNNISRLISLLINPTSGPASSNRNQVNAGLIPIQNNNNNNRQTNTDSYSQTGNSGTNGPLLPLNNGRPTNGPVVPVDQSRVNNVGSGSVVIRGNSRQTAPIVVLPYGSGHYGSGQVIRVVRYG